MPNPTQMRAAMQAYIDALNARDVPGIIRLFAADGTMEDPVGTGVFSAEEGMTRLVGALPEGSTFTLDTPIRTSHGPAAAMAFTAQLPMPEGAMTINSIDVMQFDENGLITQMRAYYGPENVTTR